ncbi:hypothetical protein CF319_g8254 [Tilletia indica]|nr:hypothetical protein CF319_g8254 [Tilletia indica]KAE8229837.1 hypothetical protein CF326_g5179 [Tilletia indica]
MDRRQESMPNSSQIPLAVLNRVATIADAQIAHNNSTDSLLLLNQINDLFKDMTKAHLNDVQKIFQHAHATIRRDQDRMQDNFERAYKQMDRAREEHLRMEADLKKLQDEFERMRQTIEQELVASASRLHTEHESDLKTLRDRFRTSSDTLSQSVRSSISDFKHMQTRDLGSQSWAVAWSEALRMVHTLQREGRIGPPHYDEPGIESRHHQGGEHHVQSQLTDGLTASDSAM